MARHAAALLSLALFGACGPRDDNNDGIADGVRDPNNISLVAPSTPMGSLSGQLLTTRLEPLAEASVSLTLGDQSSALQTTTDASGNFHFTKLPAGSEVLVTMTKGGHATLRARTTIPSAAGNFPINDGNASVGPFTLTELDGSLQFIVLTRTGKPAKGARGILEAAPAGTLLTGDFGSYGTQLGLVVAEANADDAGLIRFSGIPGVEELTRIGGRYDLTIAGYDEDDDGTTDFSGTFVRYTARSLLNDPTTRVVQLADLRSASALALSSSNVESMLSAGSAPAKNMVRPGESLYFVFNQAVAEGSLTVRLADELGLQSLSYTKSLRNGDILVVSPQSALEVGREYNVYVRATSLENGSTFAKAGFFFGADPNQPQPLRISKVQYADANASSSLTSGETVTVLFNQPIRNLTPAATVQAFINYDFNGSGAVGDAIGEYGATTGFALAASEPTSEPDALFALQASEYTTRYTFTFVGANGVPNQQQVQVGFGRLSLSGYQTIWGTPVSADEAAALSPP